MTIDMLRNTSLRELLSRFGPGSHEPPLQPGVMGWFDALWLTLFGAGRGSSFAVRNLPHGLTLDRAVDLMEATAADARELKRRAGIKGWYARVKKPGLAVMLYWDGESPPYEPPLISDAIDSIKATDLQAIIVRGANTHGRYSSIILNTVHPETGIVCCRQDDLYLALMRWHLSQEDDDVARDALQRGKVATVLESLRRQDQWIYSKLPERIRWALEDMDLPHFVPHTHIGSVALRMFFRGGPSDWEAEQGHNRDQFLC